MQLKKTSATDANILKSEVVSKTAKYSKVGHQEDADSVEFTAGRDASWTVHPKTKFKADMATGKDKNVITQEVVFIPLRLVVSYGRVRNVYLFYELYFLVS